MNILELFCGTKSVGKCCEKLGWNSISVDMNKKFNPTHLCNILDFDYKQYPKDYFDIIWSSPPCTEYSKAKTRGVRDIGGANEVVLKTIEIIEYFGCNGLTCWFIENPQTSLLKHQPFMKNYKYVDGDYCMYGLPYRKRTRFWTNASSTLKLCDKNCGSFKNGKHIGSCGNGMTKYTDKSYSLMEKYRVPEDLILSLFLD